MRQSLSGRGVFYWFAGFFGAILCANAALMWLAAATYDGLQDEDTYRQANHFNALRAEAREQAALGWRAQVTHRARGSATDRSVTAELRDAQDRPLSGLQAVETTFVSPVRAEEDVRVSLANIGGGRYSARVRLPRPGKWRLRLLASGPNGERFRAEQEIFIAP